MVGDRTPLTIPVDGERCRPKSERVVVMGRSSLWQNSRLLQGPVGMSLRRPEAMATERARFGHGVLPPFRRHLHQGCWLSP